VVKAHVEVSERQRTNARQPGTQALAAAILARVAQVFVTDCAWIQPAWLLPLARYSVLAAQFYMEAWNRRTATELARVASENSCTSAIARTASPGLGHWQTNKVTDSPAIHGQGKGAGPLDLRFTTIPTHKPLQLDTAPTARENGLPPRKHGVRAPTGLALGINTARRAHRSARTMRL
jgi:hypothetical protein